MPIDPPRRVGPTFSIQFGMSHLLIVAPLATLLVSTSCAQAQAPVQLDQDQPFGQLELVATFSGAMPTGIAVSHSGPHLVTINFPRWGDDVPYTVAELVNGNTVPYPNAEINDWPGRSLTDPTTTTDESVNSSHFVSVQSVVVDPPTISGSSILVPPFRKGPVSRIEMVGGVDDDRLYGNEVRGVEPTLCS